MTIIKIKDLYFNRGKKVIFDNICIKIKKEKITAIMGPSGCGKTTLLKIIGGQLKVDKGIITIRDKNINDLSKKDMLEIRKDIGMLFQNGALFSDLNVYENIAFPIKEHTQLSDTFIRDLVLIKLQSVGLRGTSNLMPSQLSIGMARRVALARTIALDPSIIMYDEPFSGQDPMSMATLIRLINLLNKSLKITTIIVSHDVYETMSIADYVYIINEKKIIAEGSPEEIEKNKHDFVQYFINKKISYNKTVQHSEKSYEDDLFYNK